MSGVPMPLIHCPHCNVELRDGRSAIGMRDGNAAEGPILYWHCPRCGGNWHRFSPGDTLFDLAAQTNGSERDNRWLSVRLTKVAFGKCATGSSNDPMRSR